MIVSLPFVDVYFTFSKLNLTFYSVCHCNNINGVVTAPLIPLCRFFARYKFVTYLLTYLCVVNFNFYSWASSFLLNKVDQNWIELCRLTGTRQLYPLLMIGHHKVTWLSRTMLCGIVQDSTLFSAISHLISEAARRYGVFLFFAQHSVLYISSFLFTIIFIFLLLARYVSNVAKRSIWDQW